MFCGAGGCTRGYQNVGFEMWGCDIAEQPRYVGERFFQADALERLADQDFMAQFSFVHASPPCQHFTVYANRVKDIKDRYEDLLGPTREALIQTGLPYVIENVPGAPLLDPILLCGSMFDLDVRRHRLFETNWPLENHPLPCRHKIWAADRYPGGNLKRRNGRSRSKTMIRQTVEVGTWSIPLETQKRAMGIDWDITVRELSEAIHLYIRN